MSSRKELERKQQFTQRHLSESYPPNLVNESTVNAICEKHLVYQLSSSALGESMLNIPLILSLAHHQGCRIMLPRGSAWRVTCYFPLHSIRTFVFNICIREVHKQVESKERPSQTLRKSSQNSFTEKVQQTYSARWCSVSEAARRC